MHPKIWPVFLVGLGAILLLTLREFSFQPDGKLHAYVFDVGQGDSLLLVSPSGKQILVDGGPNMDVLEHLGKHMPFFDRTIELAILTHPDSDHITALPEVLKRYSVDRIALTGVLHPTGKYEALLSLIEQHEIPVFFPDSSKDIDMGDGLVLDVIWPSLNVFATQPDNANNPSFVVRALYENESLLLAGDIEHEAEVAILKSGADIRSRILKVPHHGSRTSSSTGFLLAVDPEVAVISAGRDNKFGHPHADVVERLKSMGITVLSTAESGTIEVPLLE